MVTVIAKQKRTIAGDGGDIPCDFNPLTGNAAEWLRNYSSLGVRSRIPCVSNWIMINIITKSDTPRSAGYLYLNDGEETHTIPLDSSSVIDSDYSRILLSSWISGGNLNWQVGVPIWKREITRIDIEGQATTDYFTIRSSPYSIWTAPDHSSPGIFDEDSYTDTLGTYSFEYRLDIQSSGNVVPNFLYY